MKTIIYAFLIAALFTFGVSAQNSAKTETPKTESAAKTEAVLRVEVENGKSVVLTAKDLAKYTRREVKAKAHDEKDAIYSGYNLSDVLADAGAKIGKDELRGKELAAYLLVEAADDYRAIFSITELSADFTDRAILLADTRDGKPLNSEQGTWQIIVPDDKKHGRWVRQVIKLTIKSILDKKSTISKTDRSSEEEIIHEIIFREIIEPWNWGSAEKLAVYYLAVNDDQNPSESLLKKFADYKVSIKKVSELYPSDVVVNSTDEQLAKTRGVLFSISKIHWKSENEVSAKAGSYIGNMGSDGCEYTLKKENGKWKISAEVKCYIS